MLLFHLLGPRSLSPFDSRRYLSTEIIDWCTGCAKASTLTVGSKISREKKNLKLSEVVHIHLTCWGDDNSDNLSKSTVQWTPGAWICRGQAHVQHKSKRFRVCTSIWNWLQIVDYDARIIFIWWIADRWHRFSSPALKMINSMFYFIRTSNAMCCNKLYFVCPFFVFAWQANTKWWPRIVLDVLEYFQQ